MAKTGGFFFRTDKPLEETIREFISEKTVRNQTEFISDTIIMSLLAIDKEFFLKKYAEKLQNQHEHNNRLKVLIKMAELLDYYNEKHDTFNTANSNEVKLEELLVRGYRIECNKLYVGPFNNKLNKAHQKSNE